MASLFRQFRSLFLVDDPAPAVVETASMPVKTKAEKRAYSLNQPFPWLSPNPLYRSTSGDTVLSLPAAWSCIRYISEGIAMLDRKVLKKNGEVADGHDLTIFFNGKPDPHYTWFDFTAALIYNACLGNGFALIYRDDMTMRPTRLEHIPPNRCQPIQAEDGTVFYNIDGVLYPYTDVIHIKGMSVNALQGKDVSLVHESTFASSLSSQEYIENLFYNRALPSIAIKYDEPLDADERKTLEDNIVASHGGSVNAGRPLILDDGMEVQYLQWSPNDVALIDFRNLSVRDCARIFKVPADMLALDGKGTYSATKVRSQDFLTHCLGPWIEKIQEEFNCKLFYESECRTQRYYFEYDVSMYLRLDKQSEAEVKKVDADRLKVLIGASILTPNEARAELGLDPHPDGDVLLGDINLLPLGRIEEVALAKYLSSEGEKARGQQISDNQKNTDDGKESAQSGN